MGLRVRGRVRGVLLTCAWTLGALVVLDVAINVVFRYPSSNAHPPGSLQLYFDYGRSTEAKLDRLLGPDDAHADPIAVAGWPDAQRAIVKPQPAGKLGVSFYGMSFSNHVAEQAHKLDRTLIPHEYAGPAAPPNHSYACFLAERGGADRNPVQVFGILASSVPHMLTLTGFTSTFERPSPFTYPRYTLDANGGLRAVEPLLRSANDMRAARADSTRWEAFIEQLRRHDRFFDAWQVRANALFDASATLRLLRRAYAQRESRELNATLYTAAGFKDDPELGPVLNAMVSDFARRCRMEGQLPVVLLIQDQGSVDGLWKLVGPTLQREGIPYVSTHETVNAADPSNFVGDGHFTPANDEKVAKRFLELLAAQPGLRGATTQAATLPTTQP